MITILEGNNELNVQLVPVPTVPWVFSNFQGESKEWVSPAGYPFYFLLYSATVTNTGTRQVTKTVMLYMDTALAESQELTLGPGESRQVSSLPESGLPSKIMLWKTYHDIQLRTEDEVSPVLRVWK